MNFDDTLAKQIFDQMKDFHELKVWQKAHQLTLAVYQITATFPREQLYGLTTQLRRSSASIPANLAEGCGRNGDAEFARFFGVVVLELGPAVSPALRPLAAKKGSEWE